MSTDLMEVFSLEENDQIYVQDNLYRIVSIDYDEMGGENDEIEDDEDDDDEDDEDDEDEAEESAPLRRRSSSATISFKVSCDSSQ